MTVTKGKAPMNEKKKPNCSQIQVKNLKSPSTAPTIGGETEGALCRIAIASHSILVLRLATNVISSNTRTNVSFFFSNVEALASNSGGGDGGGDHDKASPAQ
jgi:hypothetical protein